MAGQLPSIAFISMPGTGEWLVILFIGLLIFGRRLPEVARSLGKSVNEFKKGLREFQDSADEVVSDVNRIKNDVASDIREAAELDTVNKDSQDFHHTGESTGDVHSVADNISSQPHSALEPGGGGTDAGDSRGGAGEVASDTTPETSEGAAANNPYPDVGPMH